MASKSRKSYIQLELEGFDLLLDKIEKAGGNIKSAVDECMKKSAPIQQAELKKEMQSAKPKAVGSGLINRMPPPEIKWSGNKCTAKVGYKKGDYNPDNLSDGYKAVFINYGTPRIAPREFIDKAKRKAKPKIKKLQSELLDSIFEGLK